MRLQKAELMKLVEVCSVLHEARSADQRRIARFLKKFYTRPVWNSQYW